jgi:hypothetical protein
MVERQGKIGPLFLWNRMITLDRRFILTNGKGFYRMKLIALQGATPALGVFY